MSSNIKVKKVAAIFAGGVGKRMGSSTPKQFLKIYGKEILIHTIEKFQYHEEIDSIYIGCVEEWIPLLKELVEKYNLNKIKETNIVSGGKTGQDTIYNILTEIKKTYDDNTIVLIHDGVRPIINSDLISRNIKDTLENGSSITAALCVETPVIIGDDMEVTKILPREKTYIAKAPQCFFLKDILSAHEEIRKSDDKYSKPGIVDSCSLMKYYGFTPHITIGSRENIKVTTYEDYITLLSFLSISDQKLIFDLEKGCEKQ